MRHFALLLHLLFRFSLIATLALTALVPLVYETTVLTAYFYMPLLLIVMAVLNLIADRIIVKLLRVSAGDNTTRLSRFYPRRCIFCPLH